MAIALIVIGGVVLLVVIYYFTAQSQEEKNTRHLQAFLQGREPADYTLTQDDFDKGGGLGGALKLALTRKV